MVPMHQLHLQKTGLYSAQLMKLTVQQTYLLKERSLHLLEFVKIQSSSCPVLWCWAKNSKAIDACNAAPRGKTFSSRVNFAVWSPCTAPQVSFLIPKYVKQPGDASAWKCKVRCLLAEIHHCQFINYMTQASQHWDSLCKFGRQHEIWISLQEVFPLVSLPF